MNLFAQAYPRETIEQLVQEHRQNDAKERRQRCLLLRSIIFFVLAMVLWTRLSQGHVWKKLTQKLQVLHPAEPVISVTAAALSYQRGVLGAEPLRQLMLRCCQPLCQRQTPGAFYRGYRLMALDGTQFPLADTPANGAYFGFARNQYGKGAFPLARCVHLMECGSHATVRISISPSGCSEVHGAHEVLEAVQAGMLVTHDSGLFGGALWEGIRAKQSHILAMIGSHVLVHRVHTLADGSYLAWLRPHHAAVYRMDKPMLVRVIEYQLTDERLGEAGKVYRLATTLLNAHTAPAKELIVLYHERWEVELSFDEIKTHLRQQLRVLRSKTPEGVKQEIYGVVLAHYAVRSLMVQAAELKGLDPDRLSFTGALFQIQEALDDEMTFEPACAARLRRGLLARIASEILPPRRLRVNRRELKQLYRKYKPKKRGLPPPAPFRPQERFEDFIQLVA